MYNDRHMSSRPNIKTLQNGVTAAVIALPDSPTVTTMVLTRTGSLEESAHQSGISHFLEHMCFKGTEKMGNKELMRTLDGLGAQTNAFTWYDFTGYYTKGRSKQWKKFLNIVSDIYLNSVFPPEQIEREKGVVRGEIDMYQDDPKMRAYYSWREQMYGDQSAGRPILGSHETVQAIDYDALMQYRQKNYVAENTVVVVSGNVSTKEVLREVDNLFAEVGSGKKRKRSRSRVNAKSPAVQHIDQRTDQSHIALGFPTVGIGHKDELAVEMMMSILGSGMSSRLFERLREDMGSGYYVKASQESQDGFGHSYIRTGTSHERVVEITGAIIEELNLLRTELVAEADLKRAREFILGNFSMSIESSEEIANYVGFQLMYPQKDFESPAAYMRSIKAVTSADIRRVAKKYLKAENLRLTVVAPSAAKEAIAKQLRKLGV